MASFARELSPRTFGVAMGSGTVFVPQVEVWDSEESLFDKAFFLSFPRVRELRFLDFLMPDVRIPFGSFWRCPQSDGEVG